MGSWGGGVSRKGGQASGWDDRLSVSVASFQRPNRWTVVVAPGCLGPVLATQRSHGQGG